MWAEHMPINDSQKKDILVTSTWVVDVVNVIKVAQAAHKSTIGATLNTNIQEAIPMNQSMKPTACWCSAYGSISKWCSADACLSTVLELYSGAVL